MGIPKKLNSQIKGSDVITFTFGSKMNFSLAKPKNDYNDSAMQHICPKNMTVQLDHGSAFILK